MRLQEYIYRKLKFLRYAHFAYIYSIIEDNTIFEMVAGRQDMIRELVNMSDQICENLWLITYGIKHNDINTKHWISELWACVRWSVVIDLKKLNSKKKQYTEDALLLSSRLDDMDVVRRITKNKLRKENITFDESLWDEYLKHLYHLIEYVGYGIENSRKNYLDTIFQ